MPKYFFHLTHGVDVRDETGTELQGIHEVRRHAVEVLANALRGEPEKVWETEAFRVTVTDPRDLLLLTVETVAYTSPAIGHQNPKPSD